MEDFLVEVMLLSIMLLFVGIIMFTVIKGDDYLQLVRDRKIKRYVHRYEDVDITLYKYTDDHYYTRYYLQTPIDKHKISYECYQDLQNLKSLRKIQKQRGE